MISTTGKASSGGSIYSIIQGFVAALVLFGLTIYIGMTLGIQEDLLITFFLGGLFSSFIFGVLVGITYFSSLGLVSFFVVVVAGNFANVNPEYTILFSVIACIMTAVVVTLRIKW